MQSSLTSISKNEILAPHVDAAHVAVRALITVSSLFRIWSSVSFARLQVSFPENGSQYNSYE